MTQIASPRGPAGPAAGPDLIALGQPAAVRDASARRARTIERKPFESVLAGHTVRAEPLKTEAGKTTWRVSVRGAAGELGNFETRLSAQFGAAQLAPGTSVNDQVLRMVAQQRRAPATLRVDIEEAARRQRLADGRGRLGMLGSGVHLPYLNPDFASGHAQVIAREHGLSVKTQRLDGPPLAVPQAHAWVNLPNTEQGGRIYARMGFQEVGYSGAQGGLPLPAGVSPAFLHGYRSERQRVAQGQLLQAGSILVYGAFGAAATRAGAAGRAPRSRSGPLALRSRVAPTPAVELPRSAVQARLARNPSTALQELGRLHGAGKPITPADATYALRINREAFKGAGNSRLTPAQREYMKTHGPLAHDLASRSQTAQAPATRSAAGGGSTHANPAPAAGAGDRTGSGQRPTAAVPKPARSASPLSRPSATPAVQPAPAPAPAASRSPSPQPVEHPRSTPPASSPPSQPSSPAQREMGSVFTWELPGSPPVAIRRLNGVSHIPTLAGVIDGLRKNPGFNQWLALPVAHDAIGNALLRIEGASVRLGSTKRDGALAELARALLAQPEDALASLGPDVLERLLGQGGVYDGSVSDYYKATKTAQQQLPGQHSGTVSPEAAAMGEATTHLLRSLSITRANTAPNRPDGPDGPTAITDRTGNPFELRKGRVASPLLVQPAAPIPEAAWEHTGLVFPGRHRAFIADVHGNADLLAALLTAFGRQIPSEGLRPADWELHVTGDMINKGHAPAGTVALLRGVSATAAQGSDPSTVRWADPTTQQRLEELGLGGLARVEVIGGNHEHLKSYGKNLTRFGPIEDYARATSEVMKKGFDNTVGDYLRRHPDAFSAQDARFLRQALDRHPVPVRQGDHTVWRWSDAAQDQPLAVSPAEAKAFWERFRSVWTGGLDKTGDLPFFHALKSVAESGNTLIFHGAPPLKPGQVAEVRKHLDSGTALSEQTEHHLRWFRGPTFPDLLPRYEDATAGLNQPWNLLVGGHTMGGGVETTNRTVIAYLDMGFGLNALPMLLVKPDGRMTLLVARRTPQGIQIQVGRPSDILPTRLGNPELANRFPRAKKPAAAPAAPASPPADLRGVQSRATTNPPASAKAEPAPAWAQQRQTPPPARAQGMQVYPQQTPQPQQQSRRDGGTESAQDQRQHALQVLAQLGIDLPHLSLSPSALRIDLNETQLVPPARQALQQLQSDFSLTRAQIDELIGAMLIPQGDVFGLSAMAQTWRRLRPNEPLTGDILVRLGRVVANSDRYGSLNDLSALVGYEATRYRGLYPLDASRNTVRPWIDPMGGQLDHWAGVSQPPASYEALQGWPKVLDRWRQAAIGYDEIASKVPTPMKAWTNSAEPGFMASLLRLEAFWLTVMTAAPAVKDGPGPLAAAYGPWEAVRADLPHVAGIDFSAFPDVLDRLRHSARPLLQGPHDSPVVVQAQAGLAAATVAENTFATEPMRDALVAQLLDQFVDPRAIRAQAATPDFMREAENLLLARLTRAMPTLSPWRLRQLHQEARQWAAAHAASQSAASPTLTPPMTPLRALEQLVMAEEASPSSAPPATAEFPKVRDNMILQARIRSQTDRSLLATLPLLAFRYGLLSPAQGPTTPPMDEFEAASLHEAVQRRLKDLGLDVELTTDAQGPLFTVGPGAFSGLRTARQSIEQLMNQVCADVRKNTDGLPARWQFKTTGR